MSRRIDFEDEALVVRYSGLEAVLPLVREVLIPYAAIGSVSVGLRNAPSALTFRIGYSTPPFGTTQRGRFREHGKWSFLDVDDRERAIVLELTGHRYGRVALTVDDAESLASRLRERVPDRR